MTALRRSEGQATLEVLAGAVILIVGGLICVQLLGAGYAAVMADHAAEAGALAAATGKSSSDAAHDAVPGWPRRAMSVRRSGGTVHVVLEPPSLFGLLGRRLRITSTASVRTPAG